MKVIDLFSGIGGFSLGLESTGGFKTVQFVEYEKWCQKVLAKNFPGVPITGDIKDYEGQRADVVTGGFPCQPFSVAGKRKGTDDDRHLWPEMLRVIKASKPRFVIGENVRNITSIQDGMVFEQVCTDLENEGYEVQSFIIPASAVEAPHQRYRVWIVAHSESNQEISELRTTESEHDKRNSRMESTSSGNRQSVKETEQDVANSKHKGLEGGVTRNDKDRQEWESLQTVEQQSTQVWVDTGCESSVRTERMAHEGFSVEPSVGRVAHGVSKRVDRLKGLGNAIVPQIAYQIGLAILEAEKESN